MDELREKYLQGKLTEVERKAFQDNLSPEEQQEIAFELGVREGLESKFREELRAKVAGFERKEKTVRRIGPAYMGIAASFFLVASLALYLTWQQKSPFEQYYQPYPNYELTSVRGNEDLTLRQQAYQAYDEGNYEAAGAAFNKLDSLSAADYFFRGICHIQMSNDDLALDDLGRVMKLNDKDYAEPATWYTALLYVKMNDDERAIPLLETLGAGSSEAAANARKLLSEL